MADRHPTTPTEPFPAIDEDNVPSTPAGARSRNASSPQTPRSPSNSFTGRLRSASKKFELSNPPVGMWAATATIASNLPSPSDVRQGAYNEDGWKPVGQLERRVNKEFERRSSQQSSATRRSSSGNLAGHSRHGTGTSEIQPALPEADEKDTNNSAAKCSEAAPSRVPEPAHLSAGNSNGTDEINRISGDTTAKSTAQPDNRYRFEAFENGYRFPPKHSWGEATAIGLKAFWKFFCTPFGFLVTIYGLNVVGWGAMIFFLLLNAAPAMCHPTCDDINSPRRKWIEWDSQILTALFCVTGLGLIPWRFRDLYYLLKFRIQKDPIGLRRLAGIHRGWFRLEGLQDLPVDVGPNNVEERLATASVPENCIPYPPKSIPEAPLTGQRAPPTPLWKLDFVIWSMVWNTFFQIVLCGIMWGLNRYDRPSWSTGVFVALACIVSGVGGIMMFVEGNRVKAVEGVPVSDKDKERLRQDQEKGIMHYNNIKDKGPEEEKEKKEHRFGRHGKKEGNGDNTAADSEV